MEIENWYAAVNEEGFVQQFETALEVVEGPNVPLPGPFQYCMLPGPPALPPQPTSTCRLRWMGFAVDPEWVETAPLADLQASALTSIDAAGEALRMAVISRMTTQTSEYVRAEAQARAWAATGYAGPAPRSITAWSNAKHRDGWTARQAADDILATADGWYDILDTIRELRLAKKEDVRHSANAAEIASIVADMQTDMQAIAQQLNLTLTE